ncbi:hypothetical protein FQZ97_904390 [compost metagenome]
MVTGAGLFSSLWRHQAMPPVITAKIRNTVCGMPGTMPSMNSTAAVMPITLDDMNIWFITWPPRSSSLPTRETTMAAATEISSEGICATSASPTASRM